MASITSVVPDFHCTVTEPSLWSFRKASISLKTELAIATPSKTSSNGAGPSYLGKLPKLLKLLGIPLTRAPVLEIRALIGSGVI